MLVSFQAYTQGEVVTVSSVSYDVKQYNEPTEIWEFLRWVDEPIVYTVGGNLATVKNNTVSMVLTVTDGEFNEQENTLYFEMTDGGREYYLFIDVNEKVVSFAFYKDGIMVALTSTISNISVK